MAILNIIDFDGTLINTPHRLEGKQKFENYYKKPFKGSWWWSPESLDTKVFTFKYNKEIFDMITENKGVNIILTGRGVHLSTYVKDAMESSGFPMKLIDIFRFKHPEDSNDNKEYKSEWLKRSVKRFDNVEMVNIYEDNLENATAMSEMLNKLNIPNKVFMYRFV